MRPSKTDYPEYYETYISKINDQDVLSAFRNQQGALESFLHSITEEASLQKYAADKWTIKEVFVHVSDTERIFAYRALCIARGEKLSLNSFDQDLYNLNSKANQRSWESIKNEFLNIRKSTIDLFESLDTGSLSQKGLVIGNTMTPASLGFIIAGHAIHHILVVKERYSINQ